MQICLLDFLFNPSPQKTKKQKKNKKSISYSELKDYKSWHIRKMKHLHSTMTLCHSPWPWIHARKANRVIWYIEQLLQIMTRRLD